jgi:hypothetical protein
MARLRDANACLVPGDRLAVVAGQRSIATAAGLDELRRQVSSLCDTYLCQTAIWRPEIRAAAIEEAWSDRQSPASSAGGGGSARSCHSSIRIWRDASRNRLSVAVI